MGPDGHQPGDRRHSTGGDLRGGRSKPGAKPPASYQGRRARLAAKRKGTAKPAAGKYQDGPKGVLPDRGKVTVEGYLRLGRTIADALLTTESTRTTERGEKTKGMPRPVQQPNSTRTKPDIKQKVQAAKKVGPKPGQLPEGLYQKIGRVIAESLGLVSEGIKQMDPVPPYKKPGELAKKAADARAAGRAPAKSPGLPKNPREIKKKKGERP